MSLHGYIVYITLCFTSLFTLMDRLEDAGIPAND